MRASSLAWLSQQGKTAQRPAHKDKDRDGERARERERGEAG